jgi:hypothetical protein
MRNDNTRRVGKKAFYFAWLPKRNMARNANRNSALKKDISQPVIFPFNSEEDGPSAFVEAIAITGKTHQLQWYGESDGGLR